MFNIYHHLNSSCTFNKEILICIPYNLMKNNGKKVLQWLVATPQHCLMDIFIKYKFKRVAQTTLGSHLSKHTGTKEYIVQISETKWLVYIAEQFQHSTIPWISLFGKFRLVTTYFTMGESCICHLYGRLTLSVMRAKRTSRRLHLELNTIPLRWSNNFNIPEGE